MHDKRLRSVEKPFWKCQTIIRSIHVDSNNIRNDAMCAVFFDENHTLSKVDHQYKTKHVFSDETLSYLSKDLRYGLRKKCVKKHLICNFGNEHFK